MDYMKKISVVAMLSMLSFTGFAREISQFELDSNPPKIEDYGTLEHGEPMIQKKVINNVTLDNITDNVVNDTINDAVPDKITEDYTENSKISMESADGIVENKTITEKTIFKTEKIAGDFDEPSNYSDNTPKYTTTSNPKAKFPHGLQLGVGISPTSGLNGFLGYNNKNFDSFWAKRFGIRIDFATFSPIKNRLNRKINDVIGDDGIKIDDDFKVENLVLSGKHIGAIIDFYPFGNTWFLGGWRISGGYMTGNLDLNADVHGTSKDGRIEFELGDIKYYYAENDKRATSNVKWKYSGPYVGTGFDLGLFWGFKIYMDAGVVFSDKSAKINLNVPREGLKHVSDDTDVSQSELGASKAKTLKDTQDELDKYPYYPLVKLGFMYRF
jgi:hypothetical protein